MDQKNEEFGAHTYARAKEILARYPEGRERSALLPLLHLVQNVEGYVSPAGEPTLRGVKLAQQHGISPAGFDITTPIPSASGGQK